MSIPKITKSVSNPFESIELEGSVTVGKEHAKLLSKKLGREVKSGEVFDLGLLAYYNRNRFKRFLTNLKISKKRHEFS